MKNIVNEVESMTNYNTLLQKLCQEADNKREEMKWLVQTLDSLTSNRFDHEAESEQRKLEQLITRYKNLIPTIEITMTKTDIYSRSYTYRKEVREVCTLLHRVRDQTTEVPTLESPESLKKALQHQETCLNQLEQQRANIVSMLQRGKDLLKDQHAPNFVSSEVQQLEISWNETYGQNIENLKSLKGSQRLWSNYEVQKDEILKLIAQAEEDLRKLDSVSYYNAAQVAANLQNQQELSSSLRKTALSMVKKLHETYSSLITVTAPERQPELTEEISNVEGQVHSTLEKVDEQVVKLQNLQTKWNSFQSKISELHNWTTQNAPQSIADIRASTTSPEERVSRTEILYTQIHEKVTILNIIEEEFKDLVKGKINFFFFNDAHSSEISILIIIQLIILCYYTESDKRPEAQNLRTNINNLHSAVNSLNESIVNQREQASQNLSTWKEYEVGIQNLKPWIEEAESRAASIGSKPSTLQQASEMLQTARIFEQQCAEHLPRLQNLTQISQQIGGRTSAPDEVDTVHSRWNSVHDVAVQTRTKLEKLVSSWNTFETDSKEFTEWLITSEKASLMEPNLQTPDIGKLEQELARLKESSKEISNRQAQLITLTHVSDHISHGLSIEGATNLKNRVAELKARVNKLADTVRHYINSTSDAVLARNEFQIKISDFENWMSHLRQNMAEISDVHIDNVDSNLQAVHAYLQEHSEKQPDFATIYEEVKYLSTRGSPEEAANLDEIYRSLAVKYKTLEDDLRRQKKGLEKWTELLNWDQETTAQLNHHKYEVETRKPNIDDCERLSSDLKSVQAKVNNWKEQIPVIDSALSIQVRDKQDKPLTASALINNLETQIVALETTLSAKRDKLENISTRWDNFRKLQQKITEDIIKTQTALQEETYNVDTCEKLAPAIEKISNLIEEHQQRGPARETLHQEGAELLKEDQRSVTNIQVILSSVDTNWEKVNELLYEQRKKYAEMEIGLYNKLL